MTSVQAANQKKLTFEQYLLTPYDGRRTEFVDGEIIDATELSPQHIDIVENLRDRLKAYIRSHAPDLVVKSGPGVQIPQFGRPDNSRDPDLLICTKAQWQAMSGLTKALFLKDTPPLLTIEVVSPETLKKDTQDNVGEYADAKIPEYWVVNPLPGYESVSVWVLNGRAYTLKGEFKGEQPVRSELLALWDATAAEMLVE
ncbi:MAG: Uma2 family endonuclease [Leptolyngbya sp. SIO1E4]|nr:Uma2 family endonuclease [Leptolyngbya sp. SIO1E4]